MVKRIAPPLAIASLGLGLLSAGVVNPVESKPRRLQPVYYSASNPFNQPIPDNPRIDSRSKVMIKSLRKAVRRQGFVITWRKWTIPVYYADSSTRRRSVRFTARWRDAKRIAGVPIPKGTKPDPEDDGQIAIIDGSTGCEYDFWQVKRRRGRWSASWGNSIRTDGDAIYRHGLSARGSGFALLAGLIWPEELKQGRINHALLFSFPYTKAGGPVPPATESDGWSRRRTAIPEGARLQLDPSLDLDSLRLKPYERTVARALQEYGMILGDTGGAATLYAINQISTRGNPYKGLLPRSTYAELENIPINRLRVLKLEKQIRDPEMKLVKSGCGKMVR